ncbi:MAG: hypothetical protein PF517_11240 [Salinivirgaceae bacterium]|jgi:hypothetical protein|nr:hypothetical protein [Salinivirgaceae bacterium]
MNKKNLSNTLTLMNIKKLNLLLLLFASSFILNAQQRGIREANFHFKSNNYAVALKLFEKLWENDTLNIDINYKLGLCHLNCNNNPKKALRYLSNADRELNKEPEFLFNMGKAFFYNYDFSNAKLYLENCKNLSIKKPEMQIECDLWLSYVANAKKLKRSPLDVSFINLGKYINSEMDELTPFISPDNEMLFYTSNRKYDRQFMLYSYNVYYSNISNGVFKKGRALTAVNSIDDEYMAGVSLSNERIFVQLQGYKGFQDIISSNRNGKRFRKKIGMNTNINTRHAEFGAFETANSDTLFFSSGRKDGYGGMDIYFSLKLPTGEWGEPKNLGDKINSLYDEDYPVLSNSGSKLYFTSNRPESMGGYDIFESNINSIREFSSPKNIGYPLNDVFDNKTIAFSANERYAYVSAIKPDGFGFKDIYRVVFNQMDPSVKIFILDFKLQNGETKTPYAEADTTLKVKAFQKGKVLFGDYSYHAKNSQSTIALPPGSYNIEISGLKTENKSVKFTVPDTPSGNKIEKKEVLLKTKN